MVADYYLCFAFVDSPTEMSSYGSDNVMVMIMATTASMMMSQTTVGVMMMC